MAPPWSAPAVVSPVKAKELARIFHTRPSRGAANEPGSKAREGRTTEAYSKYVEGGRPSATPETGPFPAPQQEGCEICGLRREDSTDVEGDVEGRGAVREPADREQIDAGGGDGGGGGGPDAAGGLGEGAATGAAHRLGEDVERHVVEQHDVHAQGQGLVELRQRVHLDLDLDQVAGTAAGALHGRGQTAGPGGGGGPCVL